MLMTGRSIVLVRNSDAERSEDDDGVVRSLQGERHDCFNRLSAADRLHRGDSSSRKARTMSQRLRRQRSASHPPSSRVSLERDNETDKPPIATFEEWPLGNAILKSVNNRRFPTHFHAAVYLGSMRRTRSRVPWNGESRYRFLREEALPGEIEERRVYEGRGQADFKEGEIRASG